MAVTCDDSPYTSVRQAALVTGEAVVAGLIVAVMISARETDNYDVNLRQRTSGRGLRLSWLWIPAGLFGVFAAWYLGGWFRVGLVLLVAGWLLLHLPRRSKRR
jgi:hypothetical protein